ncbi:MAG: hypothetical protein PHD32_12450 [Eubacteriales bacterium]|nr:hypothetical protein [Eubacteriales bacterium]
MLWIRLLREDLRRAFGSPIVWIAIGVTSLLTLQPVFVDFLHVSEYWRPFCGMAAPDRNAAAFIRSAAGTLSAVRHLLPFLAVLPLGIVICDDIHSGNIRNMLLRTGRASYIAGRGVSVVLAGGLAVLLSGALSEVCIQLAFPPYDPSIHHSLDSFLGAVGVDGALVRSTVWQWLPNNAMAGFLYSLCLDVIWMLLGMAFASVSLVAAAAFPNRYLALCAPFVVGYVYDYALLLCGKVQFTISQLMDVNLAAVGSLPMAGYLALLLLPTALLIGIYAALAARRFHDGY